MGSASKFDIHASDAVDATLNAVDAIEGEGDISIRSSLVEDVVKIEFEDTGPGIDPKILTQIFDPFFTTKDSGAGTGLGLAICHSIIASFGGDLEASNLARGGALFTITLPLGLGQQ